MKRDKSILFVGHCYYNHFFLSRELRKNGWIADVINVDLDINNQKFYHGSDFTIHPATFIGFLKNLFFFLKSIFKYNIFQFSNAEGLGFPPFNQIRGFYKLFGKYAEIKFLKFLRKKIIYTNNGCRDGVTQTSFNTWGPYPICEICPWKENQDICSDIRNTEWGLLRNKYADFIGILGSNRKDFNKASHVHEAPWMYSLDSKFWSPDILIPTNYRLPFDKNVIKIFHSVGNYDTRNHGKNKTTIKSTEIWLEIINRLKSEGHNIEMIFFKDVPNKQIRYYQSQADIVVDMLTYGFFGANIREAMMLGKPAICFLRPSWLNDMREEIPEYVNELPIISATPETAYDVLKGLILDKEKRDLIGIRMRKFGLKWHCSEKAALEADKIYNSLLY